MTTWTEVTSSSSDYAEGSPTSDWDEHNWDEFNWDGDAADPTWTEGSAGSTTWS